MDRARAACSEVHAGQLLARLVDWLRQADERLPVSAALGVAGAGCVAAGLCCCAWTVVVWHPHLLVLALGLALLPLAAVAHRGGLAGLLPDRLQYYLLMRTPFDLLVNEPAVRNKLRRWGRVLLLCQERSDEEIRTIIRNLDPAFMEMVFQRSIADALPQVLRLLLLPAGGNTPQAGPLCAVAPLRQARQPAAVGRAAAGGVGSLVAGWRRGSSGGGSGPRQGHLAGDLSVAGIRELMRRRADEKRRSGGKAAEPALGPVFKAIMKAGLGESGLVHNLQVQQSLRHASTVSLLLSGASGLLAWFCSTPRASGLLRSLVFRRERGHQRASRVAAASAVLGLIGAGGWLILALVLHWQSRRAAALPPTRGEVQAVDPLEELLMSEGPPPPPPRHGASPAGGGARKAARAEPESEVSPESSASEDEPGPSRSSTPEHRRLSLD